jgi:hypothetical protein
MTFVWEHHTLRFLALLSGIEGGTQTEDISEQGVEENIWNKER